MLFHELNYYTGVHVLVKLIIYNDFTKNTPQKPAFFTDYRATEGERWMNVPGCRSNLLKSPAVCALDSDWPAAQLPWGYRSNRTCTPPFLPYMVSFDRVCSFWLVEAFFSVIVWEVMRVICHCFPSAQIKGTGALETCLFWFIQNIHKQCEKKGRDGAAANGRHVDKRQIKDSDKVRRRSSLR